MENDKKTTVDYGSRGIELRFHYLESSQKPIRTLEKTQKQKSRVKLNNLPDKILRSDTRSLNRRTDQTTSGDIDPPAENSHMRNKSTIKIRINKICNHTSERKRVEVPGGAEDGDSDGNSDSDSREGVGRNPNERTCPRA